MAIDFDKFVRWADSRFNDIVISGSEVRINSIFTDDVKHKMWCSPSGGKSGRDFGVFHCFKTDEKGSLVKLVQIVDKCSRDEAINVLLGCKTMADLEKDLDRILCNADTLLERHATEHKKIEMNLPNGTQLITDLGTNNWYRKKSEEYLGARKIPIDGLYVCMEPPYKGRIIIPYYDRYGSLVYWNARHISPNAKLKYLGPPKDIGVGKGDVIFMAGSWPANGSTVHVCEGEFNAISLHLSELEAAACGGKNMTDKQAVLLSDFKIVVCLDRDKAGESGTAKMLNMLSLGNSLSSNDKLSYVRPPDKYNDWNDMLVDCGPAILHAWIKKKQRPVDFSAPHGMADDAMHF